jgi:hypothetical protein
MFETILIGLITFFVVIGIYAWWMFRTSRRYGKKGDGRH